jgi:hypothetical protein
VPDADALAGVFLINGSRYARLEFWTTAGKPRFRLMINYMSQDPQQRPLPSGLAIASMCCGIGSVVLICLWFLAGPTAIVAVVLGMVAKGQIRRGQAAGGGMATAGVVCGSITLAIYAAGIIALIIAAVTGGLK